MRGLQREQGRFYNGLSFLGLFKLKKKTVVILYDSSSKVNSFFTSSIFTSVLNPYEAFDLALMQECYDQGV